MKKTNLRRTPRKIKPVPASTESKSSRQPPKDAQNVFRQKLRGAVYDALVTRKIGEKDPLFRPCFKKLFDIVSVFSKDIPKDTNSVKKWLAVVANQNADSVIKIERELRQLQ